MYKIIGLCCSILLVACATNNPNIVPPLNMNIDSNLSFNHQASAPWQINFHNNQAYMILSNTTLAQSYASVVGYLGMQNYVIDNSNPQLGIINTKWHLNNEYPETSGIKGFFSSIGMGSGYALTSQDKYQVMLWQDNSSIMVFVSNITMDEVYPNCVEMGNVYGSNTDSANRDMKWFVRPSSGFRELLFLAGLVNFMGYATLPHAIQTTNDIIESQYKTAKLIDGDVYIQDTVNNTIVVVLANLGKIGLARVSVDQTQNIIYSVSNESNLAVNVLANIQIKVTNIGNGVSKIRFTSLNKNITQQVLDKYTYSLYNSLK